MHTKIVATIGPRTNNADMLKSLYQAGMRIARLNGSHADLGWHQETINLIRKTLADVPIILDIPGRKIRTCHLEQEPSFSMGDTIILTTDSALQKGNTSIPRILVNYAELHKELEINQTILADDGTLRFTVLKIEGQDIFCRAETSGILRSRKGINIPYSKSKRPVFTLADKTILQFAQENEVDYVGVSFVESAAEIQEMKHYFPENKCPKIIAKLENQAGIDNLEEIIQNADAIMIDRGDLSVETSLEVMAISQKRILKVAGKYGVPVIVATEMLHTMIKNPFPTKAEVTDITNAVLDGASSIMLSGETAVGDFAVESVELMQQIATAAETYMYERHAIVDGSIPSAIEDAAVLLCRSLPITKIIVITKTGYAARMLSSRKLPQPIMAISNNVQIARSFNLMYGTEGLAFDVPFSKVSTDHIAECLKMLWEKKKIIDSDQILVVSLAYPNSGNRMNLLQTHSVYDLRCSLGWTDLDANEQVDVEAKKHKLNLSSIT